MKKKNNIKKVVKKIKNLENSKTNKQSNNEEVDLWKEIRSNLKPVIKAYNKFSQKRRAQKQKKEERILKEEAQQRLRTEEALKIQEEKNKIFEKEKKVKEEKERKLKNEEDRRFEEKRLIDEREERIKQEQIYRERLIKGDEERIKLLARVSESRKEERKLRDERNLDLKNKFDEKQNLENLENPDDKEQKLKEKEQRLGEKEQRLKEEEQRLKEEKLRLKNNEKINLKEKEEGLTNQGQMNKRLSGTVLWFNDLQGHGLIKRDDNEKDIPVNFSSVQNSNLSSLNPSEQITFEAEFSDKGSSAINLQKVVNDLSHLHLKLIK